MRVGTRLYLSVIPAVLGVLVVAALAYWGERGRQAPALVVLVALVASVGTLIMAWVNTRYVAQRIALLAHAGRKRSSGSAKSAGRTDEIDAIEATVAALAHDVTTERDAGAQRVRAAERRAAEYADLLDGAVTRLSAGLDEAHLPVHILLSSPFGDLNENQEEMLVAARQAMERADTELRRLRKLIDLDRGRVNRLPQRIRVQDLLRPPLAIAEARAAVGTVRLMSDLPESLPRAIVDPIHAQEALTACLCQAVDGVAAGGEVKVRAAEALQGGVLVTITPGASVGDDGLELRLARRVLEREGATVDDANGSCAILIPAERLEPAAGPAS